MEKEELKNLKEALRCGRYKVKAEGLEGISRHLNYAGVPFLRLGGDEQTHSIHAGTFSVFVAERQFICHLENGQWTLGGEPLKSKTLVKALERADGVVSGKHEGGRELSNLYAQLNGLPADIAYCWENDENLKDVSELGEGEVDLLVRYTVKDEGGWDELVASVDDGQLYQVYRLLKRGKRLPQGENEIEVSSEEIQKYVPELYEDILEQIEEEFSVDEEYHFSVPLTCEILDATLFGEYLNQI